MPSLELSHAAFVAALAEFAERTSTPTVVAIDGYSGAGKTWLADRLRDALGTQVVRLDAIVPGWDGLQAGIDALVADVLEPLAEGRRGRVLAYDWTRGGAPFHIEVPPAPLVLVEGGGSGSVPEGLLSAAIWMDAADALRERRLDGREDAEYYRPFRTIWHASEVRLAAGAGTRDHAAVVVESADERGLLLRRFALPAVETISG